MKIIHTDCVKTCINNQSVNPVLNEPAPSIDKTEHELPRHTRSTLSQLR